jgi:hypothetical protein
MTTQKNSIVFLTTERTLHLTRGVVLFRVLYPEVCLNTCAERKLDWNIKFLGPLGFRHVYVLMF